MKIIIKPLTCLLLAFALSASAASPSLKIITIHGAPWGFIGSDGQPTGMMYEISNRIAEVAGFSYTNALVPYARTALDIENGNADFVLRFSNDQIARSAVPVATIVTMPIIAVGLKGTQFRTIEDLHGKTVGVVRTSKYVASFDTDSAILKYAVNDYPTMAKMISMRRLDAGVGSSAGFYYGAYMAGISPEQFGPPLVLGSNDFILFYSKKNATPETIKALRKAVDKLTTSGEIKQIVNKYTAPHRP
jgi:ABC-type amino acid transport substrate-binding protein